MARLNLFTRKSCFSFHNDVSLRSNPHYENNFDRYSRHFPPKFNLESEWMEAWVKGPNQSDENGNKKDQIETQKNNKNEEFVF